MDWVKDRRREELPSIWTLPYLLLSISFFLLLFLFVNIVFSIYTTSLLLHSVFDLAAAAVD